MRSLRYLGATALALLVLAPAAMAQGPNPVIQWNRTVLGILRTPGQQPPTVHPTRSLALTQVAIYDAVEAIEGRFAQYGTAVRGPRKASRPAAVDAAAHDVLVALYPGMRDQLDQQEATLLAQVGGGKRKDEGVRAGRAVAARILALRAGDHSDATPPAYTSTGAPGDFAPTPPAFAAPVFTHWARVTPWVLRRADEFRPVPPPALKSAKYTDAYREVQSLGDINSTSRTADQTEIAKFWAAPIQNYWNDIAQTVSLARHTNLSDTARLFAQLDLFQADGVIAFYDAKYAYHLWRPITAIRDGESDGNPNTAGDPGWTPLANTPADPSYPGAHSVISAGSALVLKRWFGDDLRYGVTSEALPGVTRTFGSFSAAVQEAGLSRIYAGVHTRLDDASGRQLGRDVARYVLAHALGERRSR
jgi:hypothetical protein